MKLYFDAVAEPGRIREAMLNAAGLAIQEALASEQAAGRICESVYLDTCRPFIGRGGRIAMDVKLAASQRSRGRRFGNSGSYGGGDAYAATYDEWGFLLAALYRAGEHLVVGSVKNPIYDGADHFHHLTGHTYDLDYPDVVERHGDAYGHRSGRNMIGRRGYGRVHYDDPATRWATYAPREADYLRALHAGEVV